MDRAREGRRTKPVKDIKTHQVFRSAIRAWRLPFTYHLAQQLQECNILWGICDSFGKRIAWKRSFTHSVSDMVAKGERTKWSWGKVHVFRGGWLLNSGFMLSSSRRIWYHRCCLFFFLGTDKLLIRASPLSSPTTFTPFTYLFVAIRFANGIFLVFGNKLPLGLRAGDASWSWPW